MARRYRKNSRETGFPSVVETMTRTVMSVEEGGWVGAQLLAKSTHDKAAISAQLKILEAQVNLPIQTNQDAAWY